MKKKRKNYQKNLKKSSSNTNHLYRMNGYSFPKHYEQFSAQTLQNVLFAGKRGFQILY